MRRYAIDEETGKRFLARLQCDKPGCTEVIHPHPDIAHSGWTKTGQNGPGDLRMEDDWCPLHGLG